MPRERNPKPTMDTTIHVPEMPNQRTGIPAPATVILSEHTITPGTKQVCFAYSVRSEEGLDPFDKGTYRHLVKAIRRAGWNTRVKHQRITWETADSRGGPGRPFRFTRAGAFLLYHKCGEPMIIGVKEEGGSARRASEQPPSCEPDQRGRA